MKIRNGFVTNSSSSSFIISFKDKEDYKAFKEYCDDFYYKKVKKLIKKYKKEETRDIEELRKIAKEFIYNCYIFDKRREYLDSHIKEHVPFKERIQIEKDLMETQEYKDYIQEYLKTTDYEEKIETLDDKEIIIMGEVWDTSGGIFEYAIRNGLLENEFRQWVDIVWNIG